ncbi:MAG: hypothetical protein NDI90_02615 [Nitrospira sp. BO4]|jgi:hypothetical protein|nr:hypothetical protein [Nitrospira sp. BO4]
MTRLYRADCREVLAVLVVTLVSLVYLGCVETNPQPFYVKQTLIGKSEAEIVVCAGPPRTVASHDNVRILTYSRESGPLEGSFPGTKGSRPEGVRHRCTAIVTLNRIGSHTWSTG